MSDKIDKGYKNRHKFLTVVEREFSFDDDYGVAGVSYCNKLKACRAMAGLDISLDFTGELKYKPTLKEAIENRDKFLTSVMKEFNFKTQETPGLYFSKKLNAYMSVLLERVSLEF